MAGSRMSSGRAKVIAALMFAGVTVGLGAAEVMLRLAKFEYHPFPVVQFGWPDPKTVVDRYQPDVDLGWVGRDYYALLEKARATRPGVVFMGDSCTEFGTYPRQTLDRLAVRRAVSQGIAVGVGGWSSIQGLQQLQRDILPLRPRVVTIYYGWNDHWVAYGPPDAALRRTRFGMWLASHLRLAQLMDQVRIAWRARSPTERPNRVDLATYEQTLAQMAREIRASGGAAVLVTAPTSHAEGREPEYLRARHLRRLSDLVPLHRSYIEATRRAAQAAEAELCDAAAAFEKLSPPVDQYFFRDGIHLSAAGDAAMADLLAGCILRADASRAATRAGR